MVDAAQLNLNALGSLLERHILIAVNEEWKITYWSSGSAKVTGYAPEESIGQCLLSRLTPISRDILVTISPDLTHTFPVQLAIIDANGYKKYVFLQIARQESGGYLLYGFPDSHLDSSGMVFSYYSAENLLRIDFQGNLIGFSEKYHIFQPYLQNLFSKEEGKQLLDNLAKGLSPEVEALIGNRFYRFNFTPLPELGFIYINIKDITERKLTEEKLRASVNLFRLLSENVQDLICLHHPNGDLQYVSPSVAELLGYDPGQMVSLSPHLFIHPADWIKLARYHRALLRRKPTTPIEYRIRRSDGTYCWFETIAKAIFNQEGKLVQIQSTSRNIDQRKAFEQELIKAREDALRSMKAKEIFLSTISHELRTPLNAVVGIAHLLMEENPRADQVPYLETLNFAAQNLLVLINDILDFSKIEAGKVHFESIAFDLRKLLHAIKNTFALRAAEKRLDFQFYIDRRIPSLLKGDPVRLNQILTNLVSNAIKFTEQGQVRIQAKLKRRLPEQVTVQFSVIDTGIGIAEQDRERIFDYFTQASESTTRKYGGTGLGLAIVKRLLELQGSKIELESQEGKGSRFFFELTFQIADKQVVTTKQKRFHPSKMPVSCFRVLVVEDNEANCLVARKFLEKWGIQVEVATSGAEAIQKVERQHYDLILMDLQMPEMDGYQTTIAIRAFEQQTGRVSIPIIALTASALGQVTDKIAQAGMNDYISKPFHPQELYQKIIYHFPNNFNQPTPVDLNKTKTVVKNASDSQVIQLEKITRFSLGDQAFERELINIYLKTFRQLPEQVRHYAEQGNAEQLRAIVHKVKPSLQSLAAKEIEKSLRNILKKVQRNQPTNEDLQQLAKMSAHAVEMLSARL